MRRPSLPRTTITFTISLGGTPSASAVARDVKASRCGCTS
jgi:hypothetical protein